MSESRSGFLHKRVQFGIGTLLLSTFIGMVFLAEESQSYAMRTRNLITVVLLEVIVLWAIVEVLVRNLPVAIAKVQAQNCRRSDGSRSSRRTRIEQEALRGLRRDLTFVCGFLAIITNMLVYTVHVEVIPIPIALKAAASFQPSAEQWKSELRREEIAFDKWLAPTVSGAAATERKQRLWHSWPLLVVGAAGWCFVVMSILASSYFYALRRLQAGAKFRASQYELQDLHLSVGNDDFPKEAFGKNLPAMAAHTTVKE